MSVLLFHWGYWASARWLQTLSPLGLLLFELMQVLHIFPVVRGLFILHQITMVLLLVGICLAFIRLFLICVQVLPVLPYKFSNLREGEILTPQILSHFFYHLSVTVTIR